MKTFKVLHVNRHVNPDGSRNVSGFNTGSSGWQPAGRLMPEIRNHVPEQPKSLAQKMLEARGE